MVFGWHIKLFMLLLLSEPFWGRGKREPLNLMAYFGRCTLRVSPSNPLCLFL